MENRKILRSRCPENSHPIYRVFRAGKAVRNFRCRLHFSTALRQGREGGLEAACGLKARFAFGPPFASFFTKEGVPHRGRKGEFVRGQSEAPAERMTANRQMPTICAEPDEGANLPRPPIRNRGAGFRLKRVASAASAGMAACRGRRGPIRRLYWVDAFSLVPVSLGMQAKESGRIFASFVTLVLTKEGIPCGGRKGVVRRHVAF